MKTVLWIVAAFAAYEAVKVATTGSDIFYGAYPIPQQSRTQPTLEWAAGAAVAGYLATRAQ